MLATVTLAAACPTQDHRCLSAASRKYLGNGIHSDRCGRWTDGFVGLWLEWLKELCFPFSEMLNEEAQSCWERWLVSFRHAQFDVPVDFPDISSGELDAWFGILGDSERYIHIKLSACQWPRFLYSCIARKITEESKVLFPLYKSVHVVNQQFCIIRSSFLC